METEYTHEHEGEFCEQCAAQTAQPAPPPVACSVGITLRRQGVVNG